MYSTHTLRVNFLMVKYNNYIASIQVVFKECEQSFAAEHTKTIQQAKLNENMPDERQ